MPLSHFKRCEKKLDKKCENPHFVHFKTERSEDHNGQWIDRVNRQNVGHVYYNCYNRGDQRPFAMMNQTDFARNATWLQLFNEQCGHRSRRCIGLKTEQCIRGTGQF